MIINHQDVKIIAKTLLYTTIDMATNHLLYPYLVAMNDEVIREILDTIEIHTVKNNQNLNNLFIPEIFKTNSYDNVIILEWWGSEPDNLLVKSGILTSGNIQKNYQVEYRVSFYQGSEGVSRVIDRRTLLPGEVFLDVRDRNRIINNLAEFLHK